MWNKMILHIFAALFSGFTFWKIGDGTFSLQLRLFAIFNFIFVAPGCINQMQPFFLHNRDIFETREKKVGCTPIVRLRKTYSPKITDSQKPITGLLSLVPRLSPRFLISSSVRRSILSASTSLPDFKLSPVSQATSIFK